MKKRKRRSVAASSAASRRAWRTRKKMYEERIYFVNVPPQRTIDLLPKVEWK